MSGAARERGTAVALHELLEAFCDASLTCNEAEMLANLYREYGMNAEADRLMCSHANMDDEDEDRHEWIEAAPGWRLKGGAS